MRRVGRGIRTGIIFAVLVSAGNTFSADKSAQEAIPIEWQEAKTLYDSGKYEDALHKLRSAPGETPFYFYNLGTVLLQLNQPGQALAYLEKASHLKPHDPQIQNNLKLARSSLGRLIGSDKVDPASTGLETVADRVSLNEVRAALGLLALLVAIFWLRAYLKTRDLRQTLLQPAGWIGLIGFAITVTLYAAERIAAAHPPAFLVERQAIRSGPGEQFVQLAQLESGVKIRLLGPEEQGWSQVRYTTDAVGWIRTSSLLLL